MFNEIVVVRVEAFKAKGNVATIDAKGNPNVILLPICGKIPNQAQVVAGTVALGNGLINADGTITNRLQMVHVTEGTPDPTYGRQFSVAQLGSVEPMQLIGLQKELGKGLVEVTSATPEVTNAAVDAATPTLATSALPAEKAEVTEP